MKQKNSEVIPGITVLQGGEDVNPRELKGKKGKIEQIETLNFDLGKSDLLRSIASSNKWFCDIIYYDNRSSLNFDVEQMKKLYQRCCWIAEQLAI